MGIVKWIVLGVGGIVFLIAVVFSILLVLEPPPEPAPKKTDPKALATETAAGTDNSEDIKNLLAAIELYKKEIEEKDITIDSLSQLTSRYPALQEEVEKLTVQLKNNTDKKSRAKEVSKTLTSMKVKSMQPILNKLDDETVILIYSQTNTTSRKDILSALTGERAARITQKMINLK